MKSIVKIERGMPIPRQAGVKQSAWSQVLKSMKVGDSFIWTGKSVSNLYLYARLAGIKITVREESGHKRAWRIK